MIHLLRPAILLALLMSLPASARDDEEVIACTLDLNPWGHASYCQCPEDTTYSPVSGECLPHTVQPDLCTKDINPWGNPSRCRCDQGYRYQPRDGDCHFRAVLVEPFGPCTTDVNEYGHSSLCECPRGFTYAPRKGLCAKGRDQ